nr:PREDICTED: dynein heavy chain 7, axonemal-like [Bemisia tabaci]
MSWLHTLPVALNANHKNIVKNLILRFSSLLIYWLRNRDAKEIFPTQDASLVIALMNFFECFMDDFNNEKYVETLTELDIRAQIEVPDLFLSSK